MTLRDCFWWQAAEAGKFKRWKQNFTFGSCLTYCLFQQPPNNKYPTPCRTIEFFFDFFESFSSATWLKPSTHNGAIVTPYNLGRHNLETLYHQKGKEGSLLSIFRQNTKHFFDKNGSIVL